MLFRTLWAYQTTRKMTTQFTYFELVYDTQPIMSTKFMVLTKRIGDVPIENVN
jgi:hypothetical protein